MVEPALQVSEPSLGLVGRDATHAQLVGDEDQVGLLLGQQVEFRFQLLERQGYVAFIVEIEIGGPQSHAVDHHDPSLQVVMADCLFLLNIGPFRATIPLVPFYPFAELVVPDSRGSQINRVGGEGEGPLLRITAFTRPLSAGYQYDPSVLSHCVCVWRLSGPC